MSVETITHKLIVNDDEIPRQAIAGAKEIFGTKHKPSEKHWQALHQISKAITRMAFRVHECDEIVRQFPEVARTLSVSFLPCGMGKTTIMVQTIKAILAREEYSPIAFIIFVRQHDEIKKLAKDMNLDSKDFAVIVGKDEPLNNEGNPTKKEARVLFTTQAMLQKRCKEAGSFADIGDFHYRGKPRQVRVWDEAILPSNILTLTRRKINKIIDDLSRANPLLANAVEKFSDGLIDIKDGSTVQLPDLQPYGLEVEEAINAVHPDFRDTVEALYSFQGLVAKVMVDNLDGAITLQYVDILPEDIAPMLILDASGQQRATYELWQKDRKGIQFLPSPEKSYEGFTVHHWDQASGKSAHGKLRGQYKDIAEGIARTILRDVPEDKKVLVIHYKKSRDIPDMELEIKRHLGSEAERVAFLTWGKHTATNAYQDYEYVFLAGIMQYNEAAYHATGAAAKGQDIQLPLTPEELQKIRLGEIAHHVLQAACRGKVRNAIGDKCPPGCRLYIIYSTQGGLPGKELTQRIFPESTYKEWTPVERLQGKRKKSLAALIEKKGEGKYGLKSLQKNAGCRGPKELADLLIGIEPYLRKMRDIYTMVQGDYLLVAKPFREPF